jgi:3',5'-cyclic AMP phosphodiesterase CpdA
MRDLAADPEVPKPDLMILSGDITERAEDEEFAEALRFIDEICAVTGLTRDRVVVVPGNHDVSWAWSEVYFAECKALKRDPAVPYARKWTGYQKFVAELHGATAFTEERPYRLHRFDDLRVAVAAMNSTINESHRAEDHYGWCGDEQLRWFARELGELEGTLRIAVLHHNARRKATADNENLCDEEALSSILHGKLDLLLHGHTHEGKEDRLPYGTLVLATGSAALTKDWRPGETPNQYQILQVRPEGVTRWARQWTASGSGSPMSGPIPKDAGRWCRSPTRSPAGGRTRSRMTRRRPGSSTITGGGNGLRVSPDRWSGRRDGNSATER